MANREYDNKVRHYILRPCGCEYQNTQVLPVGTCVYCRNHGTQPNGEPIMRMAKIDKKLRKVTEL